MGEHDFSSFANSCEAKERGAVRTITRFQLVEADEEEEDDNNDDEEEGEEGMGSMGTGWLSASRSGVQVREKPF